MLIIVNNNLKPLKNRLIQTKISNIEANYKI